MEAIAAPHMPQLLCLRNLQEPPQRGLLYELRCWQGPSWSSSALSALLSKHGLNPIITAATRNHGLLYLIPFKNLTTRANSWNSFAADAEWKRLGPESPSTFSATALYRYS